MWKKWEQKRTGFQSTKCGRNESRKVQLGEKLQYAFFLNNYTSVTSSRYIYIYIYICVCVCVRACVPRSSVGIATDYGLEGPGSNPSENEIFSPSIPTLAPTQPPVQWVPGRSRGFRRLGCGADPPPHVVPRS